MPYSGNSHKSRPEAGISMILEAQRKSVRGGREGVCVNKAGYCKEKRKNKKERIQKIEMERNSK